MSRSHHLQGCACCGVSRRHFLSGCATCAAGAASLVHLPQRAVAAPAGAAGKVRVRIIFALHAEKQARPDWPNIGFDFVPVMQRVTNGLASQCSGFEFVSSMATGPEDAKKIVEADKTAEIDGYLVCQMNCWNRVVQTVADTGKPTLYADFQYGGSGGHLVYTAKFLRDKNENVGYVASSKFDDLAAAVQCFAAVKQSGAANQFAALTAKVRHDRTPAQGDLKVLADDLKTLSAKDCLAKLKETKMLAFGGRGAKPGTSQTLAGTQIEVLHLPFEQLNDAWKAADKDQAEALAQRWQSTAAKVADVNMKTLRDSAAMYLGQKALLAKHHAEAITINCLGGFYGGHIHAYPCLGFHQLNNEGQVGGCECDIRSAATMLTVTALTQGRPGFISDPVIDTSARQIIYAHCVASNRVFGPKGPTNPFEILTHSEDRQGAAVRSIMPVGYMTTTVELDSNRKTILFHRGKAVANVPDDRACRTKLAVEPVGDIEKLYTEWDQWGWHRVTVYGDLKEPIFALADAMGWKVLEEA